MAIQLTGNVPTNGKFARINQGNGRLLRHGGKNFKLGKMWKYV
jgi:hypothetical protein